MSAPSRIMKRVAGMACGLALAAGCATSTTERLRLPPLQTVAHVDLSRYLGTWYEIANFPQSFQRGCTATTATYTLRADGEIDVLNRCRKGSPDGKENSALGRARVVDGTTNAKLEVSFFRPFWGDYWIIELANDYSYAVVGHPGRDYLWILSRNPTMAEATYQEIVARLRAKGYETSRLVRTVHVAGSASTKEGAPDASRRD
jgi:apolipoprotein D and lipocalin family protein